MFKNHNLKNDLNRNDNSFGGRRGGYQGYSYGGIPSHSNSSFINRNLLSSTKRFLFFPVNLTMQSLSMQPLKLKF
jgi:hypothetical protein